MPTIADYLKYANLQMAAEAFLKDPDTLAENYSGANLVKALTRGNGHASKLPTKLAEEFASQWEVLDQCANTTTGFSGTLFKCNVTDPAKGLIEGQMVISFRSTEFIDDSAHDNQATNAMEIKETGWAFGQIADVETWYKKISLKYDIGYDNRVDVTGYSLGGHLATAFNLMHPMSVKNTYTFNGAGVGEVKNGTLIDVIANFNNLRNGAADLFTDAYAQALYAEIKSTWIDGTPPSLETLQLFEARAAQTVVNSNESALLKNALGRIRCSNTVVGAVCLTIAQTA